MPSDASPAAQTVELPEGWTLTLTPALNLTSLTLRDADECPREHGFHPGPLPSALANRQPVRRLADIGDRELRDSAEQLVVGHLERVATAQANADAFGAQVPDLVSLLTGLAGEVPSCRDRVDVDPNRLTVRLSLTTDAAGSGALLELVNSWLGPQGLKNTTDGLSMEFDGPSRGLAVTLDQVHAAGFLSWLREHGA